MSEYDGILIRILAGEYAIRLPLRSWNGHASTNRYLGSRRLVSTGLPYRQGAVGDEAKRKRLEKSLAELEGDRRIVVQRGLRKFPGVRSTPAGNVRARALVDLPGLDVGRMILGAVAEKTKREQSTMPDLWLPEIELNGGKGDTPDDRRALSRIELDYLPAALLIGSSHIQ